MPPLSELDRAPRLGGCVRLHQAAKDSRLLLPLRRDLISLALLGAPRSRRLPNPVETFVRVRPHLQHLAARVRVVPVAAAARRATRLLGRLACRLRIGTEDLLELVRPLVLDYAELRLGRQDAALRRLLLLDRVGTPAA